MNAQWKNEVNEMGRYFIIRPDRRNDSFQSACRLYIVRLDNVRSADHVFPIVRGVVPRTWFQGMLPSPGVAKSSWLYVWRQRFSRSLVALVALFWLFRKSIHVRPSWESFAKTPF